MMRVSLMWRGLLWLVIGIAAGAAWGCGDRPRLPRGPVHSTVAYRFEYEVVGNAQRVRLSTQPQWHAGRFAYRDGDDRLLVITRISSWARHATNLQRKTGLVWRTDQLVERLWITLPRDMSIAEWHDLYDLNRELLVGYDEKPPGQEEFFIRPFGVQGKIMLWEDTADALILRLHMRVSPKQRPDWQIEETLMLPVSPEGIRAAKAPADAPFAAPRETRRAVWELQKRMAAQGIIDTEQVKPVGVTRMPVRPQAASMADDTTQPQAQPAEARPLVGQWLADTGQYEMRLQFDDNERFVYSSSPSGVLPAMKYGTWQIIGQYLVMRVERFEVEGHDHIDFLAENPYIILRARWLGEDLELYGNFGDREGADGSLLVRFKAAQYPDLNASIPPPRQ